MNALFLDSAGWFAALSPRQMGHVVARDAYESCVRASGVLVTTPFVIAEMHALVLRWLNVTRGRRFLELALNPRAFRVVAPSLGLVEDARHAWIERYADRSFSLCDAISFEVMRRERIERALTFDRHFAAAGFEILGAR